MAGRYTTCHENVTPICQYEGMCIWGRTPILSQCRRLHGHCRCPCANAPLKWLCRGVERLWWSPFLEAKVREKSSDLLRPIYVATRKAM